MAARPAEVARRLWTPDTLRVLLEADDAEARERFAGFDRSVEMKVRELLPVVEGLTGRRCHVSDCVQDAWHKLIVKDVTHSIPEGVI